MIDTPDCNHTRVDKAIHEDYWVCQPCGMGFLPIDLSQAVVTTTESVLDAMAGTMSAVLWDFHERAVAKYGAGVMPAPDDIDPEDCDHEYRNGDGCSKCGHNPYVGA